MIVRWLPPRSWRRTMRSAPKTTRASFMSSEGWMRNWPNPIHRLEPPEVTPMPGTSTRKRSAKVPDEQRHAQRSAQPPVVDPQATTRTTTPTAIHMISRRRIAQGVR